MNSEAVISPLQGEDHRSGGQRAQSVQAWSGGVEGQCRTGKLRCEEGADQYPDDASDHGHEGELLDDSAVVRGLVDDWYVLGGARIDGHRGAVVDQTRHAAA